jgi:hypothetical protein
VAALPVALTPLDDQTATEELLVEYLRCLATRPDARQALLIPVSRFPHAAGRNVYAAAAAQGMLRLVEAQRGELFVLANADVVFFFEADAAPLVARAVGELRRLFAGTAGHDGRMPDADPIAWLDPRVDLGRLLAHARAVQAEAAEPAGPTARPDPRPSGRNDTTRAAAAGAAALTPVLLDRLEAGLAQADLASLVRRHAVCAIALETRPEPWFVECSVSIADLARTMLPDHDLAAEPRLFRHLTGALDRRILARLGAADAAGTGEVISINLNVATLLSEAFFAFDDQLVAARRGRIVIEVRLDDVAADVELFQVARALSRARGYPLCLDGLIQPTLDLIDPARPDFEFLKLAFDPAMLDGGEAAEAWLARAVERAGVARFILAHVDSAAALAFGRRAGITLFQGSYVDRLLADARRRGQFRRLNRSAIPQE